MRDISYREKTCLETGEILVSWSHTPVQFVEELRASGEMLSITKGACRDCLYTPDRWVPRKEMVRELEQELLPKHRYFECPCKTVARRMGRCEVPEELICYGFYYQHWHENQFLRAAKEAGLVQFYDVSALPTLTESHFSLILPNWIE